VSDLDRMSQWQAQPLVRRPQVVVREEGERFLLRGGSDRWRRFLEVTFAPVGDATRLDLTLRLYGYPRALERVVERRAAAALESDLARLKLLLEAVL